MSRYIDADALQEHIEKRAIAEPWVRALMNAMVDDEPTADVRENKYSHKVWCKDGSKDLQCAECKAFVDWEDKYCHECGRILLSEG